MQELLDPAASSPKQIPELNVDAIPKKVIAAKVSFFFILCCPPCLVYLFITFSGNLPGATLNNSLLVRAVVNPNCPNY